MIHKPINSFKIVNDPVYGFIAVPKGIVLQVVDHPWFQRLNRIRQLSMTHYVYPGAQHTRFQHALGALHLMTQALDNLISKGVKISAEEYQGAQLAILLHDIGHGPYSHTLEHTIVKADHEDLSLCLMERLNEQFDGQLTMAIQIFKGKYSRNFLHQLVSGQLDIDRIDYLNRDTYFTGVSEGVIGYERIIKMLHVVNDNLVVEEKGVYSIEKFLIARRLMYWQVYLHKTVVSAEIMLKQGLKRLKHVVNQGEHIVGLSSSMHYFIANQPSLEDFITKDSKALFHFMQIDDIDVMAALKGGVLSKDKLLSYICSSLLNRKLFRLQFFNGKIDEDLIVTLQKNVRLKFELSNDESHYLVVTGKEGNSAYIASAKEEISILYKNGDVKPLSCNEDFGIIANRVEKSFLAFPNQINRW